MSESVENAPVIEVIAELRWTPISLPGELLSAGGPRMIMPSMAGRTNEFFNRFTERVRGLGYTNVTRLIPEPFPILVHQPVVRFDSPEGGSAKSLYQVGPGLFSANAVPPYDSWSTNFSKTVSGGVQALLETRDAAEREVSFNGATLRYLDAFGSHLTEGRDSLAFTREVLGISVDLPKAMTQNMQEGAAWKPFLQFHVPIESGMVMSVAIGDGLANDQPAVLMDWSLICSLELKSDPIELMKFFGRAHDIIYQSWKEMMKPISHLMPRKKAAI